VNEAEQLRAQVARLTAERQALQDEVLLLRRRAAATQTAAAAPSTVVSGASSISNSPRRHHLSHLHLPPLPLHQHQRHYSHHHHLRVQSEELSVRSSALLTFEPSSTATGGWLGGAGGGSGGEGGATFVELQAENERLRALQRAGISTGTAATAARPSSPSAPASASASTHSRSLSRAWSPTSEEGVAEGANNNNHNHTRPNHRRGRSAVVAPALSSNSTVVGTDPRDFEGTAAAAVTRGQTKRDSGCIVC